MNEKDKRDVLLRPLGTDQLDMFYGAGKHAKNCIGYLRGYFDSRGKSFAHRWFDAHDEWNTPQFKEVFNCYMNHLSAIGILESYDTMESYCSRYPETPGDFITGPNCCFVTELEEYIFCLRCILRRGDYNHYVFCYSKEGAQSYGED